MNKQLAKPQLTIAELLCRTHREGAKESLPGRMEAQSLGWLQQCWSLLPLLAVRRQELNPGITFAF